MKLDVLINKYYEKLNSNDLYILNYIKNNPETSDVNITLLSKMCNSSTASILRMTKKLGFSGYSEFKYFLKSLTASKESQDLKTRLEVLASDVEHTMKIFKNNNQLSETCDLLYNAKNIYAYGTGYGQKLMLQEFSRCMLNCGKNIIIIPAFTKFRIAVQNMKESDMVIIASLSGNARDIAELIHILNLKNIPILSITNFNDNTLSKLTPYNLYYQSSNINTEDSLNNSSYVTLNLLLNFIYEGYMDFIESK